MKKTILSLAFLPWIQMATSQEDSHISSLFETMESFQEEDGSQFEMENLIDLLNELKEHKLDLNQAEEEEFDQLPFLNDRDAHNLVLHRQLYGNYQTIYELKNIPSLGMEKIEALLPYVTIGQSERERSIKEMLQDGQTQIYLSSDRFLQDKKGYETDGPYLGDPWHYYGKYLFNAEKIKASFVGEKDAGESAWSPHGRVFDFYSGSLSWEGKHCLRHLCVGDYKANFGQGLVVGTGSILGKNASVTNAYKNTQGLKRYASTGEADFFRGIGATLGWKVFRFTAFGSIKKGDATLYNEAISSFKTDGMHRTLLECDKKGNYTEHILGGNLQFKKGNWTIGTTALYYHYSRELSPTKKRYTLYRLSDTDHHGNFGIDYKLRLQHLTLFGEYALDAKGHFATLNGASLFPLSRLEITLVQRHYNCAYQSNYGKGFSENSRIENEQGLYLSTKFTPFKRIVVAAYMDAYKFPWALYATDMPSSGEEYCIQTNVKLSQRMDETIKFKYKGKEGEEKQTLRSTLNWQWHRWRLQTIAEGNRHQADQESPTYGWILSQSVSGLVQSWHLSLSIRYAYFHAENYNNRIYIYEKDLPYTLSFPMHYGIGHRAAIGLMWKKSERLQLHAKAGWFIYTDGRENIGTGNEMMQGNVSTQVKMMVKVVI